MCTRNVEFRRVITAPTVGGIAGSLCAVTTASISTPATVTPAASGRVRSLLRDTVGFMPAAARLLWRHWPVLLAFALGGTLARELLIEFTPRFTAWGGGL